MNKREVCLNRIEEQIISERKKGNKTAYIMMHRELLNTISLVDCDNYKENVKLQQLINGVPVIINNNLQRDSFKLLFNGLDFTIIPEKKKKRLS